MFKTCSITVALVIAAASPAGAQWKKIAPGVDYRQYSTESRLIHVTRVDLRKEGLRVIGTREADKGTTVSEYARRNNALVAINGDYFDDKRKPIGLAIGPCGQWEGTEDTQREGVFAVVDDKARIYAPVGVLTELDEIDVAVSGWPMLVRDCRAVPAAELPGSDSFTRSPHPRSAVGLSKDRTRLFLVVAEGRKPAIPGLTLSQLGYFMKHTLGVCSAINLDGGGSSAMWIAGCRVNDVSDGRERSVANHIGIVLDPDYVDCERGAAASAPSYAASCPREELPPLPDRSASRAVSPAQ
jgi:uncharacterized protein YigE (DUF2233 family)